MERERLPPPFPPEMETAEYWEEIILSAVADWLLGEMEAGRIAEPGRGE